MRLAPLRKLRALTTLSDEDMVRVQRANLLDPGAPNPSVETLLHAFLPHKFVDHTHATAVLEPGRPARRRGRWSRVYAAASGIVPYIMPGFGLAKKAAEVFEAKPAVEGLVLLKHGIFTFGDDAREAYERMIAHGDAGRGAARARPQGRVRGRAIAAAGRAARPNRAGPARRLRAANDGGDGALAALRARFPRRASDPRFRQRRRAGALLPAPASSRPTTRSAPRTGR